MDEEQLRRDLDAIEREKKEFLENGKNFLDSNENDFSEEGSDEFENVETEETEFSLTEDEINEWINELTRLKEDKEFILLEIDEENALKINYQEESSSDSDEELEEDEE